MTKQYIRSLLKNTLRQIDKTSLYHNTYLDYLLETAINQTYFEIHAQSPMALGQYTKRYASQTVTLDATSGRYQTALTVSLVPLPDKRGGVRTIVAANDLDLYFAPMTDQELNMTPEGTEAYGITTTIPIVMGFVTRPTMIEYSGMTAGVAAGGVHLDLLVAFHSLLETDVVPLPYGQDMKIIADALKILGLVPPKDLLDNNASITQ